MSRRLYPVPKKVIRSSATSGWGAGCKFGSWGCWEGIDANRRLTTIQSISLAPSRKPGTGIQRTGWVRARCGRPSLFATRGVPCQWRSRSARHVRRAGHAGETGQKAGVCSPTDSKYLSPFGHRALEAALGARNRRAYKGGGTVGERIPHLDVSPARRYLSCKKPE